MHFPAAEQLALPCDFAQFVPGKPNHEGQRYLPLIVLRLPSPVDAAQRGVRLLGLVDRHHVVAPELEGQSGIARLVLLLSAIQVQGPPYQQGLRPEPRLPAGRLSIAPLVYGQVVQVVTWEVRRGHLPFETLYAELLLDVGIGVVGVRTSVTAAQLAEQIGTEQVLPGDWLAVRRSRIDVLAFQATGVAASD